MFYNYHSVYGNSKSNHLNVMSSKLLQLYNSELVSESWPSGEGNGHRILVSDIQCSFWIVLIGLM